MATIQEVQNALPVLQPETAAFARSHRAIGSLVDGRGLAALDKLMVGINLLGIKSKVKDIAPFRGTTLAGAAIKLISAGAATISGFVESTDLLANGGLDGAYNGVNNTSKYVDLGFDFASAGLTTQNFGIFIGMPDPIKGARQIGATLAFGALASTYSSTNTTATSTVFLAGNANSNANSVSMGNATLDRVVGISGNTTVSAYKNASLVSTPQAITSVVPDGNINLFRFRSGSSTFYLGDAIHISIITSGLTATEAKGLQLLIIQYMSESGSYNVANRPKYAALGTSIGAGSGASVIYTGGYASLLARKANLFHINSSVGSSQFRQDASTFPGMFGRHPDLYALNPSMVTIEGFTNDIGADVSTNGDYTLIIDAYSKLTTTIQNLVQRGIKVMLLTPPWRSAGGTNKILAWAGMVSDVATAQDIAVVDTYWGAIDRNQTAADFPDGLHPANGYHLHIAEKIMAAMNGRSFRSVTLDPPSIAAGASAELTVVMYGALPGVGMGVSVSLPIGLENGLTVRSSIGKNGGIYTAGTITPGSGYTNGTYSNVALTGGSGSGATATIVVAGGIVTSVTPLLSGSGFVTGDSLTATVAGGSGFSFLVGSTKDAVTLKFYNSTGSTIDPASGVYGVTLFLKN